MIQLMVIGLDAATWDVIKPNINRLPTFKKLLEDKKAYHSTIILKEKPLSASVWCSMFTGLTPEKHKHLDFHKEGTILKRKDINADFIWDIICHSHKIVALQIPFVYPPYNYNCEFKPLKHGLLTEPEEIEANLNMEIRKASEIIKQNPDVFIMVITALDQISHFYWGMPELLKWYIKIDEILNSLIKNGEELIIISDHGFCDWNKSTTHTLPKKTKTGRTIKGDHSTEAILITKNVDYDIKKPQDVFKYMIKRFPPL